MASNSITINVWAKRRWWVNPTMAASLWIASRMPSPVSDWIANQAISIIANFGIATGIDNAH